MGCPKTAKKLRASNPYIIIKIFLNGRAFFAHIIYPSHVEVDRGPLESFLSGKTISAPWSGFTVATVIPHDPVIRGNWRTP